MSIQSKVNKALGIGGNTTKEKPVYAEPASITPPGRRVDTFMGHFTGTFAESKAEKDLRVSQKAVDEAQAALHATDPNNISAIQIARRKMEALEKTHHKVWITHHEEVLAIEAKQAKAHKGT